MASTITALAVLGAAVLPDGADAAIPNGWVATATLPDDGVSTFQPTNIVLTVQDYGFDAAGNLLSPGDAGAPVRTIRGAAIVRQQYPNNNAGRLNSASGGTRTVYFSLQSEIYAGSVIVDAQAEAGYYGASAPGSIAGVTNGSTLAYPRAVIGWLNLQHERVTGAAINVEAVAYHRHARNGQQVAAIKFTARDAAGNADNANAQIASAPALSDIQTGGPRVEAWKATLPLANMPQADLCQVNAIVYPWIGDASSVLDTSDPAKGAYGTVTAGTKVDDARGATPLRFLCDKTGGYGGAHFAVKAGAAGGTVQASYALAVTTPFPTVQAGIAALPAWNNVNKGHNDHSGGTGWLMDDGAGGAVDHVIGATSAAAGKCWTEIRVDPAATGQVRLTLSALAAVADLLKFHVPFIISATGNVGLDGGSAVNSKRAAFEAGCSVTYTATPSIGLVYRLGLHYWRNVTFSSAYSPFGNFGSNRTCPSLVLGCTGSIARYRTTYPYTFVGNRLEGVSLRQSSDANWYAHGSNVVLANNIFWKMPNGASFGTSAVDGFAMVQNVFEASSGFSAGDASRLIGPGQSAPISNMISMHNTIPGVGVGSSNMGRQNAIYTDSANTVGVQKQMVEKYELLHQRNCKTDTFTDLTTVTGRTGNWRYRYGVGAAGNVVVTGDAEGGLATTADPSGNNWSGEFLEPGSTWAAGEANVTYTNNASGSTGAGLGDYSLTGPANAAYARVPADKAVLKYDLAGTARLNDGTGAAGAYERTDTAPASGTGGGTLGDFGGGGAGKVPVTGGGGGAIGDIGGAGDGGAPPATGSGGGALGDLTGGGAGAVTDPPITATGDILATAERTVTPAPVPTGNGSSVDLSLTAYPWAAPFDPADRTPYAIDWSLLLEAAETIEQIDRIRMSPEGAALGIQVDSSVGRSPVISTDGKKTQVWFLCDPAFQSDPLFSGAGVQVGLSVLTRTNADPYKQFERTAVLTVRQQ